MVGLQYVLQVFKVSNTELAQELDIDRSNITIWFSGSRSIPKKYLSKLAAKFKMPEEYLTNKVDDIRKLEINNIKLKNENEIIKFEDTLIDESGELVSYIREALVNDSTETIEKNEANINSLKSIKELQTTLSSDHSEDVAEVISTLDENAKLISLFNEIMKSQKVNKLQIKKIFSAVLLHLNERKGFGELYGYEDDKFVMQLVKLLEKQEEIRKKEAELWAD